MAAILHQSEMDKMASKVLKRKVGVYAASIGCQGSTVTVTRI